MGPRVRICKYRVAKCSTFWDNCNTNFNLYRIVCNVMTYQEPLTNDEVSKITITNISNEIAHCMHCKHQSRVLIYRLFSLVTINWQWKNVACFTPSHSPIERWKPWEKFIEIVRFVHFQIWNTTKIYRHSLLFKNHNHFRSEIIDGKEQNKVLKTCTPDCYTSVIAYSVRFRLI